MIQAMTTGSDVSSLFPHVVNGMQTNHIEVKKLVYLYVMKYGKAQPDLATFAIPFFQESGAKALAATICVAKLFDSNTELAGGQGFFVMLPDMLGGAKPMVVANAVVPLCGISSGARRKLS